MNVISSQADNGVCLMDFGVVVAQ